MKAALIFLSMLFLPGLASADTVTVCAEFERGPELNQLIETCDILTKIDWPDWENKDCLNYFARVGGREVFERVVVQEANATKRQSIRDRLTGFDVNLPLPVPAPIVTPTPTTTPTATPTATPTSTPTATP